MTERQYQRRLAAYNKNLFAFRIFALVGFSIGTALVLGMLYHRPLEPGVWMMLMVCGWAIWFTISVWREDIREDKEEKDIIQSGAQPVPGGAG